VPVNDIDPHLIGLDSIIQSRFHVDVIYGPGMKNIIDFVKRRYGKSASEAVIYALKIRHSQIPSIIGQRIP
jgi:hypothetical protein